MLVIAHRGASGYAPENTLASINLGIEQGCDGVEIDVQLTKDKKVVVYHDWTVDRTTNGTGEIRELNLSEIRQLDAGSWFSEEFKGEKIPLLEEVLELIPKSLLLNIEVKAKAFDRRNLEGKVADILRKHNRIENTVISSFNHYCLKRMERIMPEVKVGILFEAAMLDVVSYAENKFDNLYSLHPNCHNVDENVVKQAKDSGLKIYTWTVNDVSTAERLKKLKVDGVITNYPDVIKKL